MDDLHRWWNKTLAGLSRRSDTAMAIRYAVSRWRALTRYLDHGSIEIDNSAAERALWPWAARTISSPVRMLVENARLRSIRCWAQPN